MTLLKFLKSDHNKEDTYFTGDNHEKKEGYRLRTKIVKDSKR